MKQLLCGPLAALALSVFTQPAGSQVFQVIHPEIQAGGFEFEVLSGIVLDSVAQGEERSVHEVALGFAPVSYWKTKVALKIANPKGDGVDLEAVKWENVLMLPFGNHGHDHDDRDHGFFELGAIGFYAALELPQEGGIEYGEIAIGPVAEISLGPVEIVSNLFVEFPLEDGEDPGLVYALSAAVPVFETEPVELALGFEIHGGFEGAFGDAPTGDHNAHLIGPAIYSAFGIGGGRVLEPRLGILFGLTDGSPDAALSFNVGLKF